MRTKHFPRVRQKKVEVDLQEEIEGSKNIKVKIYAERLQLVKQKQLLAEFERLYGFQSPFYSVKALRRRILYKFQEIQYGGLSEEHKGRLKFIADNDPLTTIRPRPQVKRQFIKNGLHIFREWKGEMYEIVVVDQKFKFNYQLYDSLSDIAWLITGIRRDGETFFGVQKHAEH